MEVRLLCDWNNHRKGDTVRPDSSHADELIRYGYAGPIPLGIDFILVEVSIANKESEWLWNSLKENE